MGADRGDRLDGYRGPADDHAAHSWSSAESAADHHETTKRGRLHKGAMNAAEAARAEFGSWFAATGQQDARDAIAGQSTLVVVGA